MPPPDEDPAAPLVTVAVITHRRPQSLARLLASLAAQELGPDGPRVQVVVVDNDATQGAREVVAEAAARGPWPVRYVMEPEPGIPFARQRSVDESAGSDAVVFVDDDEWCPPHWLRTLVGTWRAGGADVVTGPVHGVLPPGAPAWNHHADVHSSRGRHPTGRRLDKAYTNNTLVSSAVLDRVTPAFDPAFRYTGSSDLHFFLRVHRAGFVIVWCEEAEVSEHVDASRTTLRWLVRRAFRSGAGDTVSRRLIHPGPRSVVLALVLATGRVGSGLLLGLRGVLLRRPADRVKGLRRVCSGAGTAAGLVGLRYEEYRPDRLQPA